VLVQPRAAELLEAEHRVQLLVRPVVVGGEDLLGGAVDLRRVLADDRRHLDQHAAPVVGIGQPAGEAGALQPVARRS